LTDFAEVLGLAKSNASQTLKHLLEAGFLVRDGDALRVVKGVSRRRTDSSMFVLMHAVKELARASKPTKHGYLGRLFKNVSAGRYGTVVIPTPDTKARRFCETLTVQSHPVIIIDQGKWVLAPTVAFLGPSQAWPNALNHLAHLTPIEQEASHDTDVA
jgi:hypothetical protein